MIDLIDYAHAHTVISSSYHHCKGMDLEYKMKDALRSIKPQVVRVEFDPPLLGYEEVKPRLLGMKADADEQLGTVRPNNPPPKSLPQLNQKLASPSARHNIRIIIFCLCLQVKAPQITHFELPFQIWTTASLILLLIYTSSAPPPDSSADSSHHVTKFWWLARTLVPGIFPKWILPPIWAFTFIVHGGEGVYMATLVRKHHMPWHIAVSLSVMGPVGL
jgi:hypothetical protein